MTGKTCFVGRFLWIAPVLVINVEQLKCGLCDDVLFFAAKARTLNKFQVTEFHGLSWKPIEDEVLRAYLRDRRNELHVQTSGWGFFEVIEVGEADVVKLIIASSNKDKRKRALTLGLLAAAEILNGSIRHRLAVGDRVLNFVDLVKDKYQKCVGAIAPTVASQMVSYRDPVSHKQIDFKFEYGQLSYYEDGWVKLYQLTNFDMTTSRSTGYTHHHRNCGTRGVPG